MIHLPVTQGEPEWIEARCGIPTSSEFKRIVTPTGRPSASAAAYMAELLAEWALGPDDEGFAGTEWMERGKSLETQARKIFAFDTGQKVESVGLYYANESRMIGASPDGMTESGEPVELKCPMPRTHLMWLAGGIVPRAHAMQCQGHLWVTGAAAGWFMSYCPNLPPLVVRVASDPKLQNGLEEHLPRFVGDMLAARERLKELGVEPITEWRDG